MKSDKEQTTNGQEMIQPSLSIHPGWNLKPEQRYVYMFKNNACPPLSPNQLSIQGIELRHQENGIEVTAFIRSTIEKSVQLGATSLLLIGDSGEKLGAKVFDLSVFGDLPPNSSRPWSFFFDKRDLVTDNIPKEGWKISFELRKRHSLDLEESWKKSLADGDITKLEQIVRSVKAPKPGEVNFMGIDAKIAENGDLHIMILIRNGSDKNIILEHLPLQVTDASNEVIAKGGFALKNLEIKANTSKPWSFVFPKTLLLKEDIDLSNWKAEPIR